MTVTDELKAGHRDVIDAIEKLTSDEMTKPNASGQWSVRDLLLHLAWWDGEAIKAFAVWRLGHDYDWEYTHNYLKFNDFWIENTKNLDTNQAIQMFNLHRNALICDFESIPSEIWQKRGVPEWCPGIIEHTKHHTEKIREYVKSLRK